MTLPNRDRLIPLDNDGLLHGIQSSAQTSILDGMRTVGEALALVFGEEAAGQAMRVLLETIHREDAQEDFTSLFDREGWRGWLESGWYELYERSLLWFDGAAYAGQGIVPLAGLSKASLGEREADVQALVTKGKVAIENTWTIVGHDYDFIWKGVAARAAIDFGGPVSIEGLQLLSGLSLAVVRNAVSAGDLHPDENGNVSSEEAQAWLARRRGFCPSRWKNLADDQWPFDPDRVVTPDKQGMISVPQAAEGDIFMPDRVIRPARSSQGLSITVGAKGQEAQFSDFYDALTALARMDVPRWRRRNSAGNWGIVRARGAWIAVSKTEIDRQLAEKLAEAS